mgnify:CR=1 FL=1
MKRQRIVAAWLACIMAAFVLPFAALAEGGDIAISLSGGNAELAVGDYLSINVKFDAAVASFGGAEFNVEYDSAKLEFVSYTPLIGSADETGNGALNYHKKIRDGNIKILLLNAANIINKNSTGIANGTAIGNLVFKVTGENADTASVKIAQEGFAACMPGDNTTAPALTPADSTFTPTTVTVSDSVTYPTDGAPTVYCITSEANGVVTLSLKASIADLQRLDMQLTLTGYENITAVADCPLTVNVGGNTATITYNAQNGSGVDMRSGVAVLTMKKSGASQSIISEPKAIATKDANGALSPITKPTVTDDPLGGRMLGDVDGDGNITLRDAMFIFQAKANKRTLSGVSALCADTDKDGKITLRDAMFILQYKANKRDADFNIK